MNPPDRPYVALPDFLLLTDQNLQYLDVLVYTTLKWHNNTEDDLCFPSHETVASLSGLSKRFVIKSIARLEAANIIRVVRSKKKRESNHYYFAPPHRNARLEKIPKSFFDDTKTLTTHERAMLLCIRQFFNHGFACFISSNAVKFFSRWLGLTEPTVNKQFRSLIKKGFVKERYRKRKSTVGNFDITYHLTRKIDWDFNEYQVPLVNVAYSELIIS